MAAPAPMPALSGRRRVSWWSPTWAQQDRILIMVPNSAALDQLVVGCRKGQKWASPPGLLQRTLRMNMMQCTLRMHRHLRTACAQVYAHDYTVRAPGMGTPSQQTLSPLRLQGFASHRPRTLK